MRALVYLVLSAIPMTCLGQINLLFESKDFLIFEPDNPFIFKSSFTNIIDELGRGYVYSANKEFGLGIYRLENDQFIAVDNYDIEFFNDQAVSTVFQHDEILYVGIGDFQSESHPTGLATIDISDPLNSRLLQVWDTIAFEFGVSHIEVHDDIAYLAVMRDGVMMLNVSEPSDFTYIETIKPDDLFPSPSSGDHQSRGMDIRNDTLWLAFDRGGLRTFLIEENTLTEIDKYINQDLIAQGTAAYNDVLIHGNYAYVSVDYCGLEILDISSFPYRSVLWYNPWDCQQSLDSWNGADLHANELSISDDGNILFYSAGNSDFLAMDISDPERALVIETPIDTDDDKGSYGMDMLGNDIVISFLDNFLNIPFMADQGGLEWIQWDQLVSNEEEKARQIVVYPNPATNILHVDGLQNPIWSIYDTTGKLAHVFTGNTISIHDLPAGVYYYSILADNEHFNGRFTVISSQ